MFAPLFALLVLITAAACIAGCTSTAPATCPAPAPIATPAPATTTGIDATISPSFLFVQESSSGTFEPKGNGTYTLTLDNVVPYTLYFSDRPYRIAGFTHMAYYISGFDWSVPPNAAISRPGAKESEDTMIVELSDPHNNSSARQLVYTTKFLNNYQGNKLAEFVAKADPALPRDLSTVSVFIDSSSGITCGKGLIRCPGGECAQTLSTCPLHVTCPSGMVLCPDGACINSLSECTLANECPSHCPVRCADGKCAVSSSLCPQIPG